MGAGAQASPEPKLIFPWAQGMYKPRGHKVYYYPDYPERAGRVTHAEVASHDEAYKLASALNAKTRDTCREFEKNPTITTKQLQSEFANLQKQIDSKLDVYVVQAKKATTDFDAMVPMLDRMQAMLSQRGKLRELMDSAKLPTWTQWFESFRKRLDEDITLRTIQRRLREYRAGCATQKPATKRTLHLDREFLKLVRGAVAQAGSLAKCVVEAAKPKPDPVYGIKNWQSVAESLSKKWRTLYDEIERRRQEYGVRLSAGEMLVVGKTKYRLASGVQAEDIRRTKEKGTYRVSLLVKEVEAAVSAKFGKCPACGKKMSVVDGKIGGHVLSAERGAPYCIGTGKTPAA
jgi:hypothetical protein